MRPVDADYILRLLPSEEMCARYVVANAPTIEPQRWIPCREKLPEVGQIVLKTCREFGWNGTEYFSVGIGVYDTNDGSIVAWMPLPEPYKERRTDE